MAKLIYSLDGAFLGEYQLDRGRLTVGRRPNNDIQIDNLAISGQHAAITTDGNDSLLEDLDSTNGTVVNGKAIKKHVLQHGDLIELGKYQLRYVNEAKLHTKTAAAFSDFEQTMMVAPVEARPVVAEVEPAPATAAEPAAAQEEPPSAVAAPAEKKPALAHIQVLSGPSAGKELVLSKALTTLGKPGLEVAVITRRPQGYFVTHVEGVRHPMINGQSVGPHARQLTDHDVVEIAGVKMEFFYVEA